MERNIPPAPPSWQPARPPRRALSVWSVIGITLAVVLCVGGLLYVAFIVVLIIGLNQWAANK